MLVGHLGAGLAAKAVEPRINLAVLFGAALFLDVLLWVFVLMGMEAATAPADYSERHYLYFNFAYSHSFMAAILWSVAGAVAWAVLNKDGELAARIFSRSAIIVALVVFSHWALDFLVHPAQLPIAPGGPALGLGFWDEQPLGLAVELVIAAGGLALYAMRALVPWPRRLIVIMLTVAAAVLTAFGAYLSPAPNSIPLLASISLTVIVLLVAGAWWTESALPPVPVHV